MAVAGAVHQHVQGADAGLDLRDQARNGIEIGHVEQAPEDLPGCQGFKFGAGLFVAHRAYHAMPGGERLAGQGEAEATAGAGDQQVFAR